MKQKLNPREKLIATLIVVFFGLALFSNSEQVYSTISSLFKSRSKENTRVITLENKKYQGTLLNGGFDNSGYRFVSPPVEIGVLKPNISNFEMYVGYMKNGIPTLNFYQRVSNVDTLNYRLGRDEHQNHPEFQARQDTLEILVDKYNEN